jgi:uncharacterized membrane protein YqiK
VLVTDHRTTTNNKRVVCAKPSHDALVGIAVSVSGALDIAGKGSAQAAASVAEAVQRASAGARRRSSCCAMACAAPARHTCIARINEEEYKLEIELKQLKAQAAATQSKADAETKQKVNWSDPQPITTTVCLDA